MTTKRCPTCGAKLQPGHDYCPPFWGCEYVQTNRYLMEIPVVFNGCWNLRPETVKVESIPGRLEREYNISRELLLLADRVFTGLEVADAG